MSAHVHVEDDTAPLGGPLLSPFVKLLLVVSAVWVALVVYRFAVGIGPVSAMNDGYAWGSWKIFNVIVLTALASGGYATATVVYVLNRGRYHSLIRTAIVTSVLGYTTAMVALGMDVGRPWNMWRIMNPVGWNGHSVLLEIAVCVTLYAGFLWLEMTYPALEGGGALRTRGCDGSRRGCIPIMEKAYPFIVATAIFLPTLHQSSLGSLFLLAGPAAARPVADAAAPALLPGGRLPHGVQRGDRGVTAVEPDLEDAVSDTDAEPARPDHGVADGRAGVRTVWPTGRRRGSWASCSGWTSTRSWRGWRRRCSWARRSSRWATT